MDRVKKMRIYAQHEVPHLWLIDPIEKTLEVYRFQAGSFTVAGVYAGNDKVRVEPFAEIEIDLTRLWWEA
jgi:Uma2 family endonuclease